MLPGLDCNRIFTRPFCGTGPWLSLFLFLFHTLGDFRSYYHREGESRALSLDRPFIAYFIHLFIFLFMHFYHTLFLSLFLYFFSLRPYFYLFFFQFIFSLLIRPFIPLLLSVFLIN